MSNLNNFIFNDNGALSGKRQPAETFLYNNNVISFIIFVLAIITASFWYDTITKILEAVTNVPEFEWYHLLSIALAFTFLLIVVSLYIFKVPIAASFTF